MGRRPGPESTGRRSRFQELRPPRVTRTPSQREVAGAGGGQGAAAPSSTGREATPAAPRTWPSVCGGRNPEDGWRRCGLGDPNCLHGPSRDLVAGPRAPDRARRDRARPAGREALPARVQTARPPARTERAACRRAPPAPLPAQVQVRGALLTGSASEQEADPDRGAAQPPRARGPDLDSTAGCPPGLPGQDTPFAGALEHPTRHPKSPAGPPGDRPSGEMPLPGPAPREIRPAPTLDERRGWPLAPHSVTVPRLGCTQGAVDTWCRDFSRG